LLRPFFIDWRFQVSSQEQRILSVAEKRLAVIAATAASLKAQMFKLEELRDQIRKVQLSPAQFKASASPVQRKQHVAFRQHPF
jgi:hypothetical protein